jgi:hypothetical protein
VQVAKRLLGTGSTTEPDPDHASESSNAANKGNSLKKAAFDLAWNPGPLGESRCVRSVAKNSFVPRAHFEPVRRLQSLPRE